MKLSTILASSQLYDQNNFWPQYIRDISKCKKELIIESPFITRKRMSKLLPILQQLRNRNVQIIVNTRNPDEHREDYRAQANEAVDSLQNIGVVVLYTTGHHRKLSILDRKIAYEGSLNILSFNDSCEIMRKTTSKVIAAQLYEFTKIGNYTRRNHG